MGPQFVFSLNSYGATGHLALAVYGVTSYFSSLFQGGKGIFLHPAGYRFFIDVAVDPQLDYGVKTNS